MSGPSWGLGAGRRQWMTATVSDHPWPVDDSQPLHAVGRVTARDVPPVVFLLSRKVACREAPSNHSGDKRLLGQAGDGVDPRGAVAAVSTAQADRECCPNACGDGCWDGSAPRRGPRVPDAALLHESSLARTMPTARILTCRTHLWNSLTKVKHLRRTLSLSPANVRFWIGTVPSGR